MNESPIVATAKAAAKRAGWRHRKVIYQGRRGAPDDWFFKAPGRLRIIEFKAPGKSPNAQQAREIERFREEGFDVLVIDSHIGAVEAFDD